MIKLVDMAKLAGFFQRLSRREKVIFFTTVSIVALLAIDQLILSPIYRNFQSLDQRIYDTETNIKRSIRLLDQKARMMKEAEHYASYATAPKTAEEGVLLLLKTIQDLASQASVNLLYSKPAGGEGKERNASRITLECEGQIDQLTNFFYAIENSKYLFRIEKYSLQPAIKGSSVIKCAATVSIVRLS